MATYIHKGYEIVSTNSPNLFMIHGKDYLNIAKSLDEAMQIIEEHLNAKAK